MNSALLSLWLSSAVSLQNALASPSTSRNLQSLDLSTACTNAMARLADDNGMKAANATKLGDLALLEDDCEDGDRGSRNCQINTARLASASPYVKACENADGITDVEIVVNDLNCMPAVECTDAEVDEYMEKLEMDMAKDLALQSGAKDCRVNVDYVEQGSSSSSWKSFVTIVWSAVVFGIVAPGVW